jgi:5S rRNA maturation endonuclease (ribonuclease M5)
MNLRCTDVAKAAGLGPGTRKGHETVYKCTGHDDTNPSLEISEEKNAWICRACNVGGNAWALAAFIAGVKPGDKPSVTGWLKDHGLLNGNGNGHQANQNIVATYDYQMADGTLSYQTLRYEPKDFGARRPDGKGGWIKDVQGLKRLPYHLPELLQAEYVFIVEGEKDVDNLRKIGLTATCNPFGACKWTAELTQYFRSDQHVTIISDNDEPGRKHAAQVAQSLSGKVASVKVLELAGLPEKGDVSDWLTGRDPEAAAEELCRLAEAAPEWEPEEGEQTEQKKPTGFQPPTHWELLDVANVDDWKCQPLVWIIEDIAAKGNLIFVAADSQCGKTLLALYVILHLLKGGYLFGRFKITPPNKVLYLLLEDPTRRAKNRILDMRRDIRVDPGKFMMYVAPGLTVNDDLIWTWLKDFISGNGFDFIVLDTYQKATPGISSFDDVKQGPILHRLANLTRELNVTLWIHDHYRKEGGTSKRRELDPSSMKGTGGKPQNADAFILMERTGDKIKVAVSSKDSDKRPRFLLEVSPESSGEEKFQYAGSLEDAANDMKRMGEENRQRVLDAFPKDGSWVTRAFIEGATALKVSAVKNHLQALLEAKQIECNGKSGRAIGYRISHAENSLWPKAVNTMESEE